MFPSLVVDISIYISFRMPLKGYPIWAIFIPPSIILDLDRTTSKSGEKQTHWIQIGVFLKGIWRWGKHVSSVHELTTNRRHIVFATNNERMHGCMCWHVYTEGGHFQGFILNRFCINFASLNRPFRWSQLNYYCPTASKVALLNTSNESTQKSGIAVQKWQSSALVQSNTLFDSLRTRLCICE